MYSSIPIPIPIYLQEENRFPFSERNEGNKRKFRSETQEQETGQVNLLFCNWAGALVSQLDEVNLLVIVFSPISVVEGKWFLWGKEWWKVCRTPIWNTRVGFSIGKLSISSEVTADSVIYIFYVLFYWYWSYFFDFYYSYNSCCYRLVFSGGCMLYNRLLQRRERNFCGKTPFSQ